MSPATVSIVVPVRNGERTIEKCLSSVLQTDYPASAREIIVVDNASTDRTSGIIQRYPVTCVTEAERGPSPARNRGILASRGDIVAFTDADCVVTKDWLRELVAAFDEDATWAVAGEIGPYSPATPAQRFMAMRRPWHQKAALAAARPYFVTMNVAFRRETFARVGMFDPRFITGEDQDFAWRFFAKGLIVRYAPKALVFHQHRRSGWDLFKQQLGWARGAALLRHRYGLPRGARAEWGEYRKLARAIAELITAASRYPFRGGNVIDLHYPLYTVVRELAWRIGEISSRVNRGARGDSREVG